MLIQQGDLFQIVEADFALAHCVSRDLRMGRGIAVAFKEKYGQTDVLKTQQLEVGDVGFLWSEKEQRFIYYLVTKERCFEKPTLQSLEQCLQSLKELLLQHQVFKLAMPQIGCGLDRLQWKDVKQLIENCFVEDFWDIVICVYRA